MRGYQANSKWAGTKNNGRSEDAKTIPHYRKHCFTIRVTHTEPMFSYVSEYSNSLNGPKRKSLKRNSKGLEDFKQYFSDNDNASSDSNGMCVRVLNSVH